MVAVALERRGTGRATLNDEAVRQRFGADAEAIQQVEHSGDAVALLDPQLGEVVDLRGTLGEGRRDGEGGNLVDERLGAGSRIVVVSCACIPASASAVLT